MKSLFDNTIKSLGANSFESFSFTPTKGRLFVAYSPAVNVTDLIIQINPLGTVWDDWFGGSDFQSTTDQRLSYSKGAAGSQPNNCNSGNSTWFEIEVPTVPMRLRFTTSAAGLITLKILEDEE